MNNEDKSLDEIRDLFYRSREARRAHRDAAVVTLFATLFYIGTMAIINHYADHDPFGVSATLGYTHMSTSWTWGNLVPQFVAYVMTWALSMASQAVVDLNSSSKPEPRHRPWGRTLIAIPAAVIATSSLGLLLSWIAGELFGFGLLLDVFTALGLVGVPAALRLTSKEAFTRKVEPGSTSVLA